VNAWGENLNGSAESNLSMLSLLKKFDAFVSWARPAFLWIGQLSVVILGIHLAADRLDDYLIPLLTEIQIAWPSPEAPLTAATWGAVGVELLVVVWATWMLMSANAAPVESFAAWKSKLSIRAILTPLFWAPTALAGAWVVGMAVEDLTADWLLDYAQPLAWSVAFLVAWRLAATGWLRLILRTPQPSSRLQGLIWAPLALLVAGLALKHGLPIWGWIG